MRSFVFSLKEMSLLMKIKVYGPFVIESIQTSPLVSTPYHRLLLSGGGVCADKKWMIIKSATTKQVEDFISQRGDLYHCAVAPLLLCVKLFHEKKQRSYDAKEIKGCAEHLNV